MSLPGLLLAIGLVLAAATGLNTGGGLKDEVVVSVKRQQMLATGIAALKTAVIHCTVMAPAGDNGQGAFLSFPGSGGDWVDAAGLTCPSGASVWKSISAPQGWEYKLDATGIYARYACPGCTAQDAQLLGGELDSGYLLVTLQSA